MYNNITNIYTEQIAILHFPQAHNYNLLKSSYYFIIQKDLETLISLSFTSIINTYAL